MTIPFTQPADSLLVAAVDHAAMAPAQNDIDSFDAVLSSKASKPEQDLVANILSVARSTARSSDSIQQLDSPDIISALRLQASTQSEARQMVVLAKVLGSAATGINKITSMQ